MRATFWIASCSLTVLDNYKESGYKYFHASIVAYIRFQINWVNNEDDCYVHPFLFVRNCQTAHKQWTWGLLLQIFIGNWYCQFWYMLKLTDSFLHRLSLLMNISKAFYFYYSPSDFYHFLFFLRFHISLPTSPYIRSCICLYLKVLYILIIVILYFLADDSNSSHIWVWFYPLLCLFRLWL